MKTRFKNILSVFFFFISMQSHAGLVGDGGMSGGGGGTVVGNPVGADEIVRILSWARQGLYLYFNKLSRYPYANDPRIDAIKHKIQEVIAKTDIYAARGPCKDKFGVDVDGSIHSPLPHSICISLKNLGEKLNEDNASPQTIALVAHEYAHLLGLNEEDAEAVQNQVLSSFTLISRDQSFDVVRQSLDAFSSLHLTIKQAIRHDGGLNWNAACYYAEQIDHLLRKINDDGEKGGLSFFSKTTYRERNSYYIKAIAFHTGACRFSDYHPTREAYKEYYPLYFDGKSETTDAEMVKHILMGSEVLGTVTIRKIMSVSDALAELSDLHGFVTKKTQELEMLQGLDRAPL